MLIVGNSTMELRELDQNMIITVAPSSIVRCNVGKTHTYRAKADRVGHPTERRPNVGKIGYTTNDDDDHQEWL